MFLCIRLIRTFDILVRVPNLKAVSALVCSSMAPSTNALWNPTAPKLLNSLYIKIRGWTSMQNCSLSTFEEWAIDSTSSTKPVLLNLAKLGQHSFWKWPPATQLKAQYNNGAARIQFTIFIQVLFEVIEAHKLPHLGSPRLECFFLCGAIDFVPVFQTMSCFPLNSVLCFLNMKGVYHLRI